MIIKKFTGRTEEDAVQNARRELGAGIVIMNVKTVKKKGLAGIFGGKLMEVTVSLEEEGEALKKPRRETTPSQDTAPSSQGHLEKDVLAARTAMNLMNENSQSIEKKLDSLQSLLLSRIGQEDAVKKEEADTERECQEAVQEPTEQEKFIRLLYNTMLENEVDEKYVNQVIDDVDKSRNANLPLDYILENVYQKLILKFGKAEGIRPGENGPRVVVFMGPTGVGKTTTIAKIASAIAMQEKKRIVMLTADTYRIAAAEQLRTYASILEAPFRVVYTEEDVQAALQNYREYDYVFLDTAGHSHQNEEQLQNLKKLLTTVSAMAECQNFLVLSATTKYKDLLRIASCYMEVTDFQLILTKLDETMSLGNLLNVKLFTDTEIAFVTYGQNVPEDIERFNPQKTVRQLLTTKH